MTLTLDLPPELENALCSEASELNLPLSEYILHLILARKTINNLPKTGAELVAYWQSAGIIGSRSDITDSQAYARNLRHESETRKRV